MPKKTFDIRPLMPAPAASSIDAEILRQTVDDGVRLLENARSIPLSRLHPDSAQPRTSFDPERLAALAESIRQEGILQPLTVTYRYEQDDYVIVSGERRYRAAQIAGLSEVPALISNVGQTRRYIQQLVENLQREDLNAVDRAHAVEHLKTILPGTWERVAEVVGLSKRRLEQMRELTHASEHLRGAILSGQATEDHVRAIARLSADWQPAVLDAVIAHALSTRETRALATRLRASESAFALSAADPAQIVHRVDDAVAALRQHAPRPRSRALRPMYEKALEFERVLETFPALEHEEDRALIGAILARIVAKIARLEGGPTASDYSGPPAT